MSFPVTINGNTYTEAMFEGYNYIENLPDLIDDVATVAAQVVTNAAIAENAADDARTAGGFSYLWESTTTNADPGTGKVKANHATLASATAIYISETTNAAQSIAAIIQSWDDSTSTVKGYLRISKQADLSVYAFYSVSGTVTDGGTWDTITVTYVAGNGSLADDDAVSVQFVPKGDKGDTGSTGSTGVGFTRAPVTTTGSANAYVATFSPVVSSVSDQDIFLVEANFANTGSATFNPGAGAKTIKKAYNNDLAANDIQSGMFMILMRDAGNDTYQLMNPASRNTFWIGTYINTGPTGFGAVQDGDYLLNDSFPYAAKIKTVRTICAAGTATGTSKINTTALGGTANSISTSAQTQSHSSSNSIAVGDDLKITLSSTSGCSGIYVMYEMEYA